jgi:hypothetical protein
MGLRRRHSYHSQVTVRVRPVGGGQAQRCSYLWGCGRAAPIIVDVMSTDFTLPSPSSQKARGVIEAKRVLRLPFLAGRWKRVGSCPSICATVLFSEQLARIACRATTRSNGLERPKVRRATSHCQLGGNNRTQASFMIKIYLSTALLACLPSYRFL